MYVFVIGCLEKVNTDAFRVSQINCNKLKAVKELSTSTSTLCISATEVLKHLISYP